MDVPKRKQLIIMLITLAGIIGLLGEGVYLITKPQRDAEHLVQILERLQVGHTRIEELAQAFRGAGLTATSKEGTCQTDLRRVLEPTSSGPTVSSVASSLSGDTGPKCNYQLVIRNRLLHGLGLAPTAGIIADIGTNGGTAAEVLVFSTIGEHGEIADVHFSQVEGQVTWCGRDTCVRRWNQSDGAPMRLAIAISADASSAERNRLLRINTSCFSKIGGCKNARDLLPIKENE
jgi:hypothetical protein